MKKCSRCKKLLSISMFNKNKKNSSGIRPECKVCQGIEYKAYRLKNKSKIDEYNTIYRENNKEVYKDWFKNNKTKLKNYMIKYRVNNNEKIKARLNLNYHKKMGKIKQTPCIVCGDIKSEAHHPNYENQLYVIWLCRKHHEELHKKLKQEVL